MADPPLRFVPVGDLSPPIRSIVWLLAGSRTSLLTLVVEPFHRFARWKGITGPSVKAWLGERTVGALPPFACSEIPPEYFG